MPRLAWFTPLPPARSGIAAYSADILPLLARRYEIDIVVDPRDAGTMPPGTRDQGPRTVVPSRDFIGRHCARPYDLIVYQLGNAACHDYMWPYLVRFPGLVVLHDAQLHQARAKALLAARRTHDYRSEFAFCHPDVNPGVADIVAAGLGGSLFFLWPLVRVPIESSRLVAVHSSWLAVSLADQYPSQQFRVIDMGVADPLAEVGRSAGVGKAVERRRRDDVRSRHAIPPGCILFAAYGMLTPEKRLTEILKALRASLPYAPEAHLMLVGQPADYYDVEAEAREIGVAERVTVTGYVDDEDLPAYVAAADVCLCLRWPTSRETSASLLRCLAAGKPAVVTDLAHTCSMPALDPRSWTALEGTDGSPAVIAIDILDEQHSLGLAMRRLACDEALRGELGRRAREYWRGHHTLERMAESYDEAIEAAIGRTAPDRSHLPAHLSADGTELTRRIVAEFGVSLEEIEW